MFHYTRAILRVGPAILKSCLFTFRRWAKHIDKYPPELRGTYFRKLCKRVSGALHVELNFFGLENLPKEGNYFMVCNHLSAFDPLPIMIGCGKATAFVGKMELTQVPLLRTAMKALEVECIDRDDLRQSLKVMLKIEADLKKGTKNWMIFPEGTRLRDQLLPVAEFHHGTFRPAYKAKVPIVPIAIYGTYRVLKMHPQFKKYPVYVSFLKPLYPEEYNGLATSDLAEMTRKQIQQEVTYHLRPLDHKTMSENKEKAYHSDMIV